MGTRYITDHLNSQIWAADESGSLGSVNGAVIDHIIGDAFIVIIDVEQVAAGCAAATSTGLKLQFSKDAGGFIDVGPSTEISYTESTTLVDEAASVDRSLGSAGACATWVAGKECTDAATAIATASTNYSDIHFALDTTNATSGSTYTFQVYDTTNSRILTNVVGISITMASVVSAIFTGIGSISSVTSVPGTLVTNKTNALNGISSSCNVFGSIGDLLVGGLLIGTPTISIVNGSIGTLTANQALTLTGVSSISTVPSSIGTLTANQTIQLESIPTISTVASSIGTLIAKQAILLPIKFNQQKRISVTGTYRKRTKAIPSTRFGLFVKTEEEPTAIFTGIGSISSVTSVPGTLVTNKTNALNGISSSCNVFGSIGTFTANQVLALTGVSSISTVASSIGTLTANQELLLTGIPTITNVNGSIGTLTANQELLLTGIPTIADVNGSIGTLTAKQTVQLDGISTISTVPSPIGTLIVDQTAQLEGTSTISTVVSSIGTLIAKQAIQLDGIPTISTVPSSIGTLIAETPPVGAEFIGVYSKAVVPSIPGTLTTNKTILLESIPTISTVTSPIGIFAKGHAVRAPPTLSIVSAPIGVIAIGTIIEGSSCIAASISNTGVFFSGLPLIKPIINPGVNKVTAVFTVNKKTKIYTVNKSTKILTIR